MKRIFQLLGLFLLIGIAYLLFYPVSINPGIWEAPPIPKLEGKFAVNDKLKNTDYRYQGQCYKCEDIAVDSSGNIYGGSEHGEIIQFSPEGKRTEIVNTGGRPLGLDFGKNGLLYIADADKGLLSLDVKSGELKTLSTTHGGRDFLFADDLEVADDGKVYFSDASDKFGIKDFQTDLLEHQPNGRLLVYDPATGQTDLLLDKLYFANGVALSPDSSFVLVNETGKYRVQRYWLKGPKKGTSEMFIENLPFFPDGISQGDNGIFWLAQISPRTEQMETLLTQNFMRKVVARLPKSVQPAPENYSLVLGVNHNGEVIHNFQNPAGDYAQIASIQQFGNTLYLGSLGENGVGVYEME
ncbi:MAG: SMP-30/gluconolactonase/LRE family protein [Saprospiraceae bacterium]